MAIRVSEIMKKSSTDADENSKLSVYFRTLSSLSDIAEDTVSRFAKNDVGLIKLLTIENH